MPSEREVAIEVAHVGKLELGPTAYDDLRPLVQQPVKLATNLMAVLENLVGLPCDYVNVKLSAFRDAYREKLGAIPEQNRSLPPLRQAALVLREVSLCADEPELQAMFASLLASASDERLSDKTHPGFAWVISQLTPGDAKLLKELRQMPAANLRFNMMQARESVEESRNLVRLGIAEWIHGDRTQMRLASARDGYRDAVRLNTTFGNKEIDSQDVLAAVQSGVDHIVRGLSEHVEDSLTVYGMRLTEFGKSFAATCEA